MYTNVRSKWVLGFVIVFPWISKLLRDVVFTWRRRELSCWLKKVTYFGKFGYLDSSYIRKCIVSISSFEGMGSSRAKFTLLLQNSVTDVSVGFRPPCFCPSRWAPAWPLKIDLHKFGLKIPSHIFLKKYCCDLNLGESLCIFTFLLFPDSRLNLLNGFDFYLDLFWMAWHWKPAIGLNACSG